MSVPVARPQVTAFVAAVRAQLDDLSTDEMDELTDGLEADLNDALADSGAAPDELFGDAAAYAAELRSAAGLPPRAAGGERPGAWAPVRHRVVTAREAVTMQPWWPAVRDFTITVRPVWWVARAAVAAAGVEFFLGQGSWLFLLFVVVSVELGRRAVAGRSRAWRTVIAVGNGMAVFGLLVAVAGGGPSVPVPWSSSRVAPVIVNAPVTGGGIWVDDVEVRNIFAYDSQGRPLTDVQLYDETGRALEVGESARTPLVDDQGCAQAQVPAVDATGRQRWNVYPLRERIDDCPLEASPQVTGVPQPAMPPRVSPGALIVPWGASASPSASGSPSPSASPATPSPATPSPTTPSPTAPSPTASSTHAG